MVTLEEIKKLEEEGQIIEHFEFYVNCGNCAISAYEDKRIRDKIEAVLKSHNLKVL